MVADALAPSDRIQTFPWLGADPLPGETSLAMVKLTYRNIKSEQPVPVQKIIFGTDGTNNPEGNDVVQLGDLAIRFKGGNGLALLNCAKRSRAGHKTATYSRAGCVFWTGADGRLDEHHHTVGAIT